MAGISFASPLASKATSARAYLRLITVAAMSETTGIALFLILALLSLIVVSLVNRFQTRRRLIRLKVRQLRHRIAELAEICSGIEPLLETNLVPRLINEEVIDLIRSVQRLDPAGTQMDAQLDSALQLADGYQQNRRQHGLNRIMPSDAKIAKHQFYLTEAGRLVRRHESLGRLSNSELEAHLKELAWAHLMVAVISLVAQGHRATVRGDPAVAFSFYRKAQNLLIGSAVTDERRHQLIRELGEMQNNKRQTLSREVMPEPQQTKPPSSSET